MFCWLTWFDKSTKLHSNLVCILDAFLFVNLSWDHDMILNQVFFGATLNLAFSPTFDHYLDIASILWSQHIAPCLRNVSFDAWGWKSIKVLQEYLVDMQMVMKHLMQIIRKLSIYLFSALFHQCIKTLKSYIGVSHESFHSSTS